MDIILVGLLVCGGGALCALMFRRSFAEGLPVFVLGAMALLYIFGLAGLLEVGFWLVLGSAAAGLVWAVVHTVRDKSAAWLKENFFTFAFFACVFWLGLVGFINLLRNFIASDELNFWGPFVQDTLRLGALHTRPGATVGFHQEYPPGMTLLQYLWCKLAGGYSEAAVYRATQFFTLTMFLPLFARVKARPLVDKLCLLALVTLFTLPTLDPLYYLAHLDVTLGVFIGTTLVLLLEDGEPGVFGMVNLALAAFATCLVKQMGAFVLVFGAVLAVVWVVAAAGRRPHAGLAQNRRGLALLGIRFGVVALACLLALASWSFELAAFGIEAGPYSVSRVSPAGLLAIATGRGSAEQYFTLTQFVRAVFERPVVTTPVAGLTHFQLTLAFFGVGLWAWHRRRRGPSGRLLLVFAVAVPLGAVVYAGVMLVLYWFTFAPEDVYNLAAFERYMATYWVAMATAMLLWYPRPAAAQSLPEQAAPATGAPAKKTSAALATPVLAGITLAFMVFAVPSGAYYEQFFPHTRADEVFAPHRAAARALEAAVEAAGGTEEEKVYIVDQQTERGGYVTIAFAYYGHPLRTNRGDTAIDGDGPDSGEWAGILEDDEYTLVYLYALAPAQTGGFTALFGAEGPAEGGLYRVAAGDGAAPVRLEKIATVE